MPKLRAAKIKGSTVNIFADQTQYQNIIGPDWHTSDA